MTSLVTHRYTMAMSILRNVSLAMIPANVRFRYKPQHPVNITLPENTYYLEYDTGVFELDTLLSYLDAQMDYIGYHASNNHKLIGSVAKHCIASHGWGQSTSDAITVVWMAVIGMEKFVREYGRQPSARMQFYNKAIEQGFYYDCETWKEFL